MPETIASGIFPCSHLQRERQQRFVKETYARIALQIREDTALIADQGERGIYPNENPICLNTKPPVPTRRLPEVVIPPICVFSLVALTL